MQAGCPMLEALGGIEGCHRLSAAFYARVGGDPVLRPFFPGKSLRCATEEFAAFLIQFLGGSADHTQFRWWLSLRESHARFKIGPEARSSWLEQMAATLDSIQLADETKHALRDFFLQSSAYMIGKDAGEPEHQELAERWEEQRLLDRAVASIADGKDDEAIALVPRFACRSSVFVGLLVRMVQSGRARLVEFVINALKNNPALMSTRFSGGTLLHFAAGAGSLEVLSLLLQLGVDPNIRGRGNRTPLYCVANECTSESGPTVVSALVKAGADVNAPSGVTRATPLHIAARRGHLEIARTLLNAGADVNAKDSRGDSPFERARKCRKSDVAHLLVQHAHAASRPTDPS